MNKESKKYYKQLKSLICSRGSFEKNLLNDYKEQIEEYNTNNPHISYADLEQKIGSPQELAASYYECVDTDYLVRTIRTSNIIKTSIRTLLVLICILFIVKYTLLYINFQKANNSLAYYYSEEITEDINDISE